MTRNQTEPLGLDIEAGPPSLMQQIMDAVGKAKAVRADDVEFALAWSAAWELIPDPDAWVERGEEEAELWIEAAKLWNLRGIQSGAIDDFEIAYGFAIAALDHLLAFKQPEAIQLIRRALKHCTTAARGCDRIGECLKTSIRAFDLHPKQNILILVCLALSYALDNGLDDDCSDAINKLTWIIKRLQESQINDEHSITETNFMARAIIGAYNFRYNLPDVPHDTPFELAFIIGGSELCAFSLHIAASVANHNGNKENATKLWNWIRRLAKHSDSEEFLKVYKKALTGLAIIEANQGNSKDCVKLAKQAFELDEADYVSRNTYIRTLLMLHPPDEKRAEQLSEGIKAGPPKGQISNNRIWATYLRKSGRIHPAINKLENCIHLISQGDGSNRNQQLFMIYSELTIIHRGLGNIHKVRNYNTRLVEFAGSSEETIRVKVSQAMDASTRKEATKYWEEAEKLLDGLKLSNHRRSVFFSQKCKWYVERGQLDDALECADQAVLIAHNAGILKEQECSTLNQLGMLKLRDFERFGRDPDLSGIDDLKSALALSIERNFSRQQKFSLSSLAWVYGNISIDYFQAINYLRQSLILEPNNPIIHCQLSHFYAACFKFDQAHSHRKLAIKTANERNAAITAVKMRAVGSYVYLSENKQDKAQIELEESAAELILLKKQDSKNPEIDIELFNIYSSLSDMMWRAGNANDAQRYLDKAELLVPAHPRLAQMRRWQGMGLSEDNYTDDSRQVGYKPDADSEDPQAEDEDHITGKVQLDLLDEIEKEDSDLVWDLYKGVRHYDERARSLLKRFNPQGALRVLVDGLEYYKDHPHLLITQARVFLRLDRYDDAIRICQHYLANHDGNSFVYFQMALANRKAGRPIEAAESYIKGANVNFEFEGRNQSIILKMLTAAAWEQEKAGLDISTIRRTYKEAHPLDARVPTAMLELAGYLQRLAKQQPVPYAMKLLNEASETIQQVEKKFVEIKQERLNISNPKRQKKKSYRKHNRIGFAWLNLYRSYASLRKRCTTDREQNETDRLKKTHYDRAEKSGAVGAVDILAFLGNRAANWGRNQRDIKMWEKKLFLPEYKEFEDAYNTAKLNEAKVAAIYDWSRMIGDAAANPEFASYLDTARRWFIRFLESKRRLISQLVDQLGAVPDDERTKVYPMICRAVAQLVRSKDYVSALQYWECLTEFVYGEPLSRLIGESHNFISNKQLVDYFDAKNSSQKKTTEIQYLQNQLDELMLERAKDESSEIEKLLKDAMQDRIDFEQDARVVLNEIKDSNPELHNLLSGDYRVLEEIGQVKLQPGHTILVPFVCHDQYCIEAGWFILGETLDFVSWLSTDNLDVRRQQLERLLADCSALHRLCYSEHTEKKTALQIDQQLMDKSPSGTPDDIANGLCLDSLSSIGETLFTPILERLCRTAAGKPGDQPAVHIVARGELHDLPWNALIVADPADGKRKYLFDLISIDESPTFHLRIKTLRHELSPINQPEFELKTIALINPELVDDQNGFSGPTGEGKSLVRFEELAEKIHQSGIPILTYFRKEATFDILPNLARLTRILWLGCHGRFDSNSPWNSRLLLAPSNWEVAYDVSDGPTPFHRILELRDSQSESSQLELAILSCCGLGQTSNHQVSSAFGLVHSFAYAGCYSVLAHRWDVTWRSDNGMPVTKFLPLFLSEWRRLRIETSQQSGLASRALQSTLRILFSKCKEGKLEHWVCHPQYWAGWCVFDVAPIPIQ